MKNVLVRTLSGLIYVGLMVGAVLAGSYWLCALLCVLTAMGIYEYERINSKGNMPRLATFVDVIIGMSLVGACSLEILGMYHHFSYACFWIFVIAVMLRPIMQLYSVAHNPVQAYQRSVTAILYVSVPLAIFPLLYLAEGHLILALLIFIWMNDTGAYCVGCTIGRHKLFERISPKKTWEGFFGGLCFSVASAFALHGFFPEYFTNSYLQLAILAASATIFGTFGDLFESMVKRTAGVKDSGQIIPGHGGILDRIDSLLFVLPASLVIYILMIH